MDRTVGAGLLESAQELARRGASVIIITYVNDAESASHTVDELDRDNERCISVQADVSRIPPEAKLLSKQLCSLSCHFGPKKITVNAVAPGGVKSDMYLENARHYIPNSDAMTNDQIDECIANRSPLKRDAIPEDVARVVAFLCSEDGGWVNSQTLTITGGAAL